MKLYVAGPMTGYKSFNIPDFDAAAARLRAGGYEVISPAELDDPAIRAISLASPDGAIATLNSHGQTWGDFLARDVKLISDGSFDGIVVLPGWERSRGARLETFVGNRMVGLPIFADMMRRQLTLRELVPAWAALSVEDLRYLFEPQSPRYGEYLRQALR
jgi:hypothetical protein